MNKLPAIDKYAARLLMISFFLPLQLQTFVVMGVSLYFVYRTLSGKVPVPRSNYLWALLLGSCYLLYLFAIPLTPQIYMKPALDLLERKTAIFALPVVFAIITPAFGQVIVQELVYFVYACIICCVIGNADFAYHYYMVGDVQASHVSYRLFFESHTGVHPTYMGMFICFAVCVLTQPGLHKSRLIIKYALICLLLVFLLMILAKTAIIAMGIILVHQAYVNRKHLYQHKALIVSSFVLIIAACFFIPFIGQRLSEVFVFFGHGKATAADNSMHIRKLIWDIDTDVLKKHWLTGVGPGQLQYTLNDRYFIYSLANHFRVGYYDPHNEYFFIWLCFGVIGIILFIIVLLVHVWKAISKRDQLYGYLLILLLLSFSTESVLARQYGVMFYSIFTSVFFFLNLNDKAGNSKRHKYAGESIE